MYTHSFSTAPSEVVANITAQRTEDNTILIIQWEPYRQSNGKEIPITTYEIEYRVSDGGDPADLSVVNGNSTLGIINVQHLSLIHI